MNQTNYIERANQLLVRVKVLLSQTDWTLISDTNNIRLESKTFPNICAVDCFRTSGVINSTPQILCKEVWNETEGSIKKKDPDITEYKIVDQGDNWKVYYQVNKMSWPLWSRKACCAQVKIQEGEDYWILIFSVDHEKVPLENETYVRPIVHGSIYKFELFNGKTKVSKLSHIDPSGYIPASVVSMYASKLTKTISDWMAVYKSV